MLCYVAHTAFVIRRRGAVIRCFGLGPGRCRASLTLMNATSLSRFTSVTVPIDAPDRSAVTGDPRSLANRRNILAAARALLRDEGYRTFSMEAVANLSGVTRRTVYN